MREKNETKFLIVLKMELKITRAHREIVILRKLKHVELLKKNANIEFKKESYKVFFMKMLRLPPKQDSL